MAIYNYIRDILLFNRNVVLPGFGTLRLKEEPSRIQGNKISPPRMIVFFDPEEKLDDGILTSKVAEGESVEPEEAREKVLEYIDDILFALNKGENFEIKTVGVLYRDPDGNYHVDKDPDLILEFDSFGLESFELETIEEEAEETEETGEGEAGKEEMQEIGPEDVSGEEKPEIPAEKPAGLPEESQAQVPSEPPGEEQQETGKKAEEEPDESPEEFPEVPPSPVERPVQPAPEETREPEAGPEPERTTEGQAEPTGIHDEPAGKAGEAPESFVPPPESRSYAPPVSAPPPQEPPPVSEEKRRSNRNLVWVILATAVILLTALIIISLKTDLPEDYNLRSIFMPVTDTFEVDDDFSDISDEDFEFDQMVEDLEEEIDSAAEMGNALAFSEGEEVNEDTADDYVEYHIIAGSFRNNENARQLQQELTLEGYPSSVINRNDGLYRVSAVSFRNKQTALSELYKFRRKENMQSAWLMGLR